MRTARGVLALITRDLIRIPRQPSRLVATVATPGVIWLLLASGFAGSIDPAGADAGDGLYAARLASGTALLVVLFSSIFASITLITDRHEGFLQGVLASPMPRWSLGLAKTLSGSLIAAAQGLLLLLALPLVAQGVHGTHILLGTLVLLLASLFLSGLSLAAAWWVDSTQGFHGVMNLVLMPMWLLSGSIFPPEGAAGWLHALMHLNPLAWINTALLDALGLGGGLRTGGPALAWGVTLAAAGAGVAAPAVVFRTRGAR